MEESSFFCRFSYYTAKMKIKEWILAKKIVLYQADVQLVKKRTQTIA